jgi:hypothetical protein
MYTPPHHKAMCCGGSALAVRVRTEPPCESRDDKAALYRADCGVRWCGSQWRAMLMTLTLTSRPCPRDTDRREPLCAPAGARCGAREAPHGSDEPALSDDDLCRMALQV